MPGRLDCSFCRRPAAWQWQVEPFQYPAMTRELHVYVSGLWLACSPCHRNEVRGRHDRVLEHAVRGWCALDPELAVLGPVLAEQLAIYFAAARAAFAGDAWPWSAGSDAS